MLKPFVPSGPLGNRITLSKSVERALLDTILILQKNKLI
jgi:hypothetical protein